MKALVISACAPDATTEHQTGTTNWVLRLTQLIARQHKTTLLTTPPVRDPWFEKSGVTVVEHEPEPVRNKLVRMGLSLAYGIYPSMWLLHSSQTSAYLRSVQPGQFDVCWILEDYGGMYLKDLPRHLPAAFHRSYILSMQRSFWNAGEGLKARLAGQYRKHTARAFDRWTTARASLVSTGTPESCEFLKQNYRHNTIECLPVKPCHRPRPTTEDNLSTPRGPDGRLLAAYLADMSFVRNADGARWFLQEVLPAMPKPLRKQYHFKFIGRKPDPVPDLGRLPTGSSVEFAGFVDDLTASLHQAQVAFIPVFGGNGVRLKTLTLLGTGLPTVSTLDALEGLDLKNGEQVLEATSPGDFVRALEKLLDADQRQSLSRSTLRAMDQFLGEEEDAAHVLELSRSIAHNT